MENFKSVNGNTFFNPYTADLGLSGHLVSSSFDYYNQEANFIEEQNKEFIKSRGGFIKLSEETDKEVRRQQFVNGILDAISAESQSVYDLY